MDEGIDNYWLARGSWQATRLHLQHGLTKTNFNDQLLHPSIPPPSPGALIADFACGTGAWSMDMADKYPHATFEGLDIDLNSVPPPRWTPSNVSWKQFDLLQQDLPENMVGKYDIVHLQYVVVFVKDQNFQTVLENLIKMLKSGGHLQWTEANACEIVYTTAAGETAIEASKFDHMAQEVLGNWKENKAWLQNFKESFEKAGLENVHFEKPVPKPSTMLTANMQALWGMEEGLRGVASKNESLRESIGVVLEQWKKAIEEAGREKVGLDMKMTRTVGRKRA